MSLFQSSCLFGAVYLPEFSVQAALRIDTAISFHADAVAILDGPDSLQKVVACNVPARRAGIALGMSKAQAETLPNISFRKRAVEQEQATHAALLDCGNQFSPRVESTCAGTIVLDLNGTERLLGTAQVVGKQLAGRARASGLVANVGIAGNPDSALHAARGFAGITVISAGEEAKRLANLPVEVLQPDAETLDILDSWGIRDLKSLAALPEIPLSQRLGQQGIYLRRLARGEVQRELVLTELPFLYRASMELEEPVDLLEPLAFVLNRLLEQLTERLAEKALATDHVRVDLTLEIHSDRQVKANAVSGAASPVYERTLKLPAPTQDPKVLLKLLQLDLEAHPPHGPVKKVAVEAFAARIRLGQGGLFEPQAPEPAKLEITLARLRALVGEQDEEGRGRVGFPQVLDSNKPDSFFMRPSMPDAKERKTQDTKTFSSTLQMALRRFRPPIRAKVEMNKDAPAAIIFSGLRAKVKNASGPWRISGAWWEQAEQWQREEWDVEISVDGGIGLYKMFREVRSGQWYVEGLYD
jgi:protein ImuB